MITAGPAASPVPVPPTPLLGLDQAQLEAWVQAEGQPAYRGRQLHQWIYSRSARSVEAITVLPKAWRQRWPQPGPDPIGRLAELHRSTARDGTVKLLLATADGLSLETVGIPSPEAARALGWARSDLT